MAEILDQLRILIEQIINGIGIPGISLVMFAESVFPPIPSELVMPFAGFMVNTGHFNFWAVLFAGTLGSVSGALALYYIGVWSDDHIMRALIRRYGRLLSISEQDFERALGFFDRYGEAVIFFGRFIPLVRSLISIPAGMDHMPLPRFLFFTVLGSLIWNGGLCLAGLMLGTHWQDLLVFIKQYEQVTLLMVGILIAVALVLHLNRLRRRIPVKIDDQE